MAGSDQELAVGIEQPLEGLKRTVIVTRFTEVPGHEAMLSQQAIRIAGSRSAVAESLPLRTPDRPHRGVEDAARKEHATRLKSLKL
jgi:hypothetical protein